MSVSNAPVRRHSRESGNPVPFTSCADTQRHWIPDIATRFRDDDQTQSASNLKSGWIVAPVSEIADHCLGKMLDKQKNKGVLRPYLRNLNVRWFGFDLSDVLEMRFEEGEADRYQAKKGDLIICEGGYPGRAAIWESDDPVYLQKALHRVRFHEPERAKWVLYWLCLRDMSGTLTESFNGAGIQHFTKAALARFDVPLPPLEEQKRIVAVLDQAFAALDRARAHVEANLANAQELFDNTLSGFFSLPRDGWIETAIGDCIRFIDYRGRTPEKTASGLRLITAKNVKKGYLQDEPREFVAEDSYSGWMTRGIPVAGDVLFTTEAPLGNVAQLDTTEKVVFAQRVIIMQPDINRIDSTFLKYMLLSSPVQKRIHANATGATALGIKASLLKTIKIAFPEEIAEQRGIVEKLVLLQDEANRLESHYTRKLADLATLRQSLLHQAFSGQLT